MTIFNIPHKDHSVAFQRLWPIYTCTGIVNRHTSHHILVSIVIYNIWQWVKVWWEIGFSHGLKINSHRCLITTKEKLMTLQKRKLPDTTLTEIQVSLISNGTIGIMFLIRGCKKEDRASFLRYSCPKCITWV